VKSKIVIHRIPEHSPEWYAFRENGIGGSDISALLGLNPYKSAVQVFYEKIGVLNRLEDNRNLFWGRTMEDMIANVWQYVDGTDEGYIKNFNEGNVIRKCRKVNGYAVNPDYPWLFYSIDRLMNKGSINLATGEVNEDEAILEIKTANSFALSKWEDGIPPEYIAQPAQGMLIFEVNYGETAIFDNLRGFKTYPISGSEPGIQSLQSKIVDISKSFWYDRVLPAKEIAKKEGYVSFTSQDTPAGIQALEPDYDNTENYKEFMSLRYRTEPTWATGSLEQLKMAFKWKCFTEIGKAASKGELEVKNWFAKEMINLDEIRFDDLVESQGGRIDNKLNRYEKLQLNNRIKDCPREEDVNELIEMIDGGFGILNLKDTPSC